MNLTGAERDHAAEVAVGRENEEVIEIPDEEMTGRMKDGTIDGMTDETMGEADVVKTSDETDHVTIGRHLAVEQQ